MIRRLCGEAGSRGRGRSNPDPRWDEDRGRGGGRSAPRRKQNWSTPAPTSSGRLRETFEIYPDIGTILPAMGYGEEQLRDLEATINATDCDAVVIGTPIDLSRIVDIKKPNTRVFYDLEEVTKPDLTDLLGAFVEEHGLA